MTIAAETVTRFPIDNSFEISQSVSSHEFSQSELVGGTSRSKYRV